LKGVEGVNSLYKLLIVEDEEIIREGLKEQIQWEKVGFEVIGEAVNGKVALDIIINSHPDVVFTDIRMPVINGIELMSRLKSDYPYIKIIILSGYSEFEYARKGIECGAYAYILKPTRRNDIIEVFTRLKNEMDVTSISGTKIEDSIKQDSIYNENQDKISSAIDKSIKYINRNYNKKISLEEVAECSFVNTSYFCTLFKQKTGYTFTNYLSVIRINKAKELLLNTECRINEVAVIVGYDDWNYFSRVFKKIVGISPLQYKEAYPAVSETNDKRREAWA